MITIKRIESIDELKDCLHIRRMSFIVEKSIPEAIEVDSYDKYPSEIMHFLVLEGDVPVSTFRAMPLDDYSVKLQRICTLKAYRGMGYGRAAMDFASSYFRSSGYSCLMLHSQDDSVGFYKKCGFKVTSDMFIEADIPHYEMKKTL